MHDACIIALQEVMPGEHANKLKAVFEDRFNIIYSMDYRLDIISLDAMKIVKAICHYEDACRASSDHAAVVADIEIQKIICLGEKL